MSYSVTTPPESEIMTAQDAVLRQHLNLGADEADWDELIDAYIASARARAESYTRKKFLTQTIQAIFTVRGNSALALPVGPVQSVISVEYLDDEGNWVTVEAGEYRVHLYGTPAYLVPETGADWPYAPILQADNLRINYVAGFGDESDAVDRDILQAIRVMVAFDFVNRGDDRRAVFSNGLHPAAEDTLSRHRDWF
ncbi:MAG: phage head-tail connector protein [Shimia thalassica]|uniref:head-tail connector protein n=1 Tax=Shimia thalassica TaxID=1715693 RepID=UPI0032981188